MPNTHQRLRALVAVSCASVVVTLTGTSPAAAETPPTTIVSPAEGATVPVGFAGPIVVDTTGAAQLDVTCASIGYQYTTAFTANGATDVPIDAIAAPAGCHAQVTLDGVVAAARNFQVAQLATLEAPSTGARVPTGFTGPFQVAVAPGLAEGTGQLGVACPSTGYADQVTFPTTTTPALVSVPPIGSAARDCTATVRIGETVVDTAAFSVWTEVAFSRGLLDAYFFPTVRDGFAERARLSYTISTAAQVTYTVRNADRKVIRRERARVGRGRHQWSWDGTLRSERGEKSRQPGLYYLSVTAYDPLAQGTVGLIGTTRIKTRVLTKYRTVTVAASQAERHKRGRCGFGAEGGWVAMLCDGTTSGSSAELSHSFRTPVGGRATHYGFHYVASYLDEGPGKIVYGRRVDGNRVEVYVRINGHRSIVIGDLYVEYTIKVRQRPGTTVPQAALVDLGDAAALAAPAPAAPPPGDVTGPGGVPLVVARAAGSSRRVLLD